MGGTNSHINGVRASLNQPELTMSPSVPIGSLFNFPRPITTPTETANIPEIQPEVHLSYNNTEEDSV